MFVRRNTNIVVASQPASQPGSRNHTAMRLEHLRHSMENRQVVVIITMTRRRKNDSPLFLGIHRHAIGYRNTTTIQQKQQRRKIAISIKDELRIDNKSSCGSIFKLYPEAISTLDQGVVVVFVQERYSSGRRRR